MAKKKSKIPNKLLPWVEVKEKYRLSDVQIQMARELGMTPKSMSKIAPSRDQPWKLPRGAYIEQLYRKTFRRERPERIPQFSEPPPPVKARPRPPEISQAGDDESSSEVPF